MRFKMVVIYIYYFKNIILCYKKNLIYNEIDSRIRTN